MIVALIFTGMIDLQRKFLAAMGYPIVPTLCQIVGVVMDILLNWAFIERYKLVGVGYATLISQATVFCLILIYTHCIKAIRPACFNPFTRQAVSDVIDKAKFWAYFKLVVPSTLMFFLEWGAFQFLILMAGYFSTNALAAQVALYNIVLLGFMLAYGISIATSTLVGNSIGAGKIALAKKYARMIVIGSVFANATECLIVLVLREQVAAAYMAEVDSDSHEVQR